MKLISCHIDGFGCLRDTDVDLRGGLNVFLRENGLGKSTFAAFIRVMFYGFEGEGRRDPADNERRRFLPWGGGAAPAAYGGRIVFETGGRRLRIERSFGVKARDDVFSLYDAVTGLPSADLTDPAGEAVFGMDALSFRRTVYIGQQDIATGPTARIHARIGGSAPDDTDMSSYTAAMQLLKKRADTLTPERSTGAAARARRELEEMQVREALLAGKRAEMTRLAEELRADEAELSALAGQVRVIQDRLGMLAEKEREQAEADRRLALAAQRASLVDEVRTASDRVASCRARLGALSADDAALDDILSGAERLSAGAGQLEAMVPSREEDLAYRALLSRFPEGLPDPEDMARARQAALELSIPAQSISLLSDRERRTLEEARLRHPEGFPSDDELAEVADISARLARCRRDGNDARAYGDMLRARADDAARREDEAADDAARLAFAAGRRRRAGAVLFAAAAAAAAVPFIVSLIPAVTAPLHSAFSLPAGPAFLACLIAASAAVAALVLILPRRSLNGLAGDAAARQAEASDDLEEALSRLDALAREQQARESLERELEERADAFLSAWSEELGGAAEDPSAAAALVREKVRTLRELSVRAEEEAQAAERSGGPSFAAAKRGELDECLRRWGCGGGVTPAEAPDRIAEAERAAAEIRRIREKTAAAARAEDALAEECADLLRAVTETGLDHMPLADAGSAAGLPAPSPDVRERAASLAEYARNAVRAAREGLRQLTSAADLRARAQARLDAFDAQYGPLPAPDSQSAAPESRSAALYSEPAIQAARDVKPGDLREQLQALSDREASLRRAVTTCREAIAALGPEMDSLSADAARIPSLKDEVSRLEDEYRITRLAMDRLADAKAAYASRYMDPVMAAFRKYYRMLTGREADQFETDADLDIRVRAGGALRDISLMSAGDRDLIGLCRRFSMADAMFPQEKPFLILDDPFVNLDVPRTEAALRFLREAAEERQILYFTCHESRVP